MSLLTGFYQGHPSSLNRVSWAAIQVVLSLALRAASSAGLPHAGGGPDRLHRANIYLKNAQSVISDLVTREEDLLGMQVLLGIALLFQDSSDAKPASVVIGTAMRLAHRLRLHSKEAARHFTAQENLERSRIFWIAYTLDKVASPAGALAFGAIGGLLSRYQDISLRVMTPSVQSDSDIDTPLPALVAPGGIGLIWSQDRRSHLNYHRLRVDLAHIQGLIYDLLCSNRSAKAAPEERQRRVCRLQGQLDQWHRRIPAPFNIENAASTLAPGELVMMIDMYYAYLLATIATHGLYSHNAQWLKMTSSRNQIAIQDLARSMDSCAGAAETQSRPFPGGWSRCVELSRACMVLFEKSAAAGFQVWYAEFLTLS